MLSHATFGEGLKRLVNIACCFERVCPLRKVIHEKISFVVYIIIMGLKIVVTREDTIIYYGAD